jgi:molybdopterin-guanine dinucleotide biosynthesis protein A
MPCSVIILSGGRGTRAGGVNKGLLPYRGSTLVELVLQRIAPQADEILISANRNREQYDRLGHRVVGDKLSDFQGPLAGLQAALPQCNNDRVLVVACDMPQLPFDLAERLLPPLEECQLSYAWDGERDQYLVAALHRNLTASLEAYLASGERSVRGWYSTLDCRRVDFSDTPAAFRNINQLPGD